VNDPGTILSGSLNLNLIDPSGSDNHVTINDILTTDFTDLLEASLDGTATVDLLLEADVGSDPNLPYISAVLSVEWDFLGNDGLTGQEPIVSIHDVSLHFGDFLSKLIGPVVDQLDDWIEPIKPILDFLNTEIPVISDVSQFLGGAPVTVISLISGALGEGGDTVQKTFDILNAIVGIVSATSGFGDDIAINFGDFNFSQDLRTPGSVNADTSGTLDESGDGSAEDQLDDEAAGNAGLAGILDDLQEIGLDIPIITSPLNIIKLLLGQRVDLITWDIPRLEAGFEFEQSFGPLLPPVPLYARIFGSLSVFADFFIGLDTRGFEPGHTVFDGFYFGDFDGDGNEMPELGLNATIGAGAELNVVIAKAGVEGGVSADLGADWNDLDDDGKVYFDELGIQLGRGLKCVFDLSGQLSAFLNFYASLGLSTPFGDITLWDKTINLLNITLFDFSYTCPPLPPPILAHVSDGTDGFAPNTLVGHIGPFASLRQPGATDGKDKITITALLDEGTGLPIPNAYLVSGFGEEQPYYGVTSIYFDGGAEADDIRADATVTVPITLFGGDGDDKLDGGSGPDSISGGDGIDWIYGFDGADILNGDDGNDVVFGGLGNDTSISGGDGDDQLYGEEGNDTMYGGDGSDIMYGDAQPDNNGNSTGSGNDVMDGDDGDDVMNGAGGNDDMDGGDGADFIEGIDGNDTAHGGDGNDVINGDLGNDVLYGGDDDDVIRGFNDETQPGGADDDEIYGDEGFDDLAGNNGNDFIVGGTQSDAILGGLGNDTILSGWGDDVIHGDDGLDYIEGGPDNDDICGQGQTDTIWGGTTVYGFPYILLGYVDPFTDGGFVQTSCTSPIIFIPPTEIPHDGTTTISGQKYHDLNANGVHDPNEPGLDRWTITLYDATGGIVASQLTYSSDLNSDGSIDPYSEMGLYEFAGIAPGTYKVAETLQPGWFQSEPTGPVDPVLNTKTYQIITAGGDGPFQDLDFGNYRRGAITGQKFQDSNGNGRQDGNEIYLNNWTIQLYNQADELVATQVTHTVGAVGGIQTIGYYEFNNLDPGDYRVVEVLQPGWVQTASPSPIDLSSNETAAHNDFGNKPSGEIHGHKWEDTNGDGKHQENEPGLAGVTIYIDTNNNDQLDPGEPFTITSGDNPEFPGDETGEYSFTGLMPGAYTIREIVPTGYVQTMPQQENREFVVNLTAAGMTFTGADFGNAPRPSSICGAKFLDKNKDGKRQSNEPLLPGWVIYLDLNNNGTRDPGEPLTTTSTDGQYCFDGLRAGEYHVYEQLKNGWSQTAPGNDVVYYKIVLTDSTVAKNVDFGNVPGTFSGTNGRDNITITRGPAGTLDIYDRNNPSQVPVFSHAFTTEPFTIDLKGGNDSIWIDLSSGNPLFPGLTINGHTGNDFVKVILPAVQNSLLIGPNDLVLNGILIGLSNFNQMEVIGGSADDMLTINGAVPFSPIFRGGGGQNQLILNDSHYDFPAEFLTDGINLNVEVHNDGELFFHGDQSLNSLIAHEAAHVVQQSHGVALRLNQLDIGPNATVDLDQSDLILQATTATRQAMYNYLFAQIARARNTGQFPATRWMGPGLTSELAHQYPNGITTLGLYQHNQTDLEFLHGFPLDDNSLIVRFTYVGDVNGDGTMNADDYAQIDAGFATHALGYANGDLDYRGGPPNSDDYFGADHAFFNQGPPINPPPPQAPALTPTAGGEIHGNKFWDINADGVRQTTEVGISGVTIYLDKNNNGVFEPAIDIGTTTLTDDPATPGVNEAGNYAFLSLAPGTYIVREVVPAGFIQTAPTAGFYTVTIDINIVNNLNFGNRPSQPGTGEIHGNKFSDTDGDGKRENGEPGLSGVVIYLDRDNSGTLSSGDISTVTQNDNPNTPTIDETGNYDFYGLPPATYIIREVVPSGYTQTAPANGSYLVEIGQGGVATGRDFGNRPNRGTISGTKFRDLDGDGKRDPNEGGIGGVTIYIDLNGNGQPDAGEPTTTTAPDGTWSFTNVPTGTYTIAEVVPPGYAQTAPVGGTFTLTFNGQTTSGLDFGNRRGEITGTKFEDRDGDGKRGANEPALPGVTIYLDLNRNGRLDENEPAMLTMNDDTGTPEIETGRYFFQDLPVGAYQVREIVPAGYTVTIPIGGLGDVPQLKAGETVTINFGNKLDIGISGAKWDDLDGDGRRVQGEPGLAGVTIYLDLNQNGQLDANEPWTITAADGSYSFTNLTTGIYTVCEVIPSGYAQTFPQTNNGCHVVQVGAGVVPGRDFGNSNLPGSIHGTKWNDLNANRMRDAGEPGLAGVFIYVDLNNNGVFDTGEPSTTSLPDNPATPGINEAGIYWIYNVPPGTWPVREVVPAGFGQSYPGVALIGSDATGMLYDFNMTTGAATNPRPTIPNLVGISQGLGFTGIHGLTSTGQLVSINETTGAWVLLGAVAATLNEGDLEFDPATGDLYGLYGSGSTLYRINPITGAPTLVGALATPDPSALAFDSSGNLFVFDGTAMKIANINKANGALISAVSISGPNLGPTSGMDFDPLTGILYLATSGNIGGAVPTLYTLNPTTGALTTIGPTSGVRATNTTFVLRDRNIAYVLPGSTINGIDFGNYQAQILPDGDDKIRGGDAADTIHGDNGSGFPAPIITIGGKDTVYGDAAADEIYGQDTDDLLYGGDDNDIIFGNDGNDTMDGNAGNDTTSGGAGDDTYVFTTPATATTDTVNELFAEGSDWFDMSDVATLLDFDFNVSNATRSTNLTIVLQDGFGADGSAYMENIQGAVTQTNKLTGNSADNILVGGNLSDTVTGNLGNNQLFGSDGDDIFIPSAGTDIIVSGDIGYDRLDYSAFPLGVTINLQTHSGTHVTSFTDIELFIGSAFSDTLIGQNIANSWHITGSNAGDVNGAGVVDFTAIENLSGGSATDTFIFSDGASVSGVIDGDGAIDSLIYSAYTTAVTVDLTAGAATGAGGVQNIENVIGGSASDVITGDANANVLIGGAGNNTIGGMDGPDTLVGGAGDDSITGGNGNDLYIMTNGGGTDTIVEVVGGGTDTITFASVTTPVTVDLQNNIATGTTAGSLANIESLIGTSGPDTLIGQDIANIWNITGLNSGNINGALFFSGFEILNGGSLSDSFNLAGGSISVEADGKFGPDTLNYAAFGGPVSVNLATHVAPLVGTFANIESLVGTASNDQLIGDNIANAWHLTALNAGDINGVGILDFSSFENLTGGSLADTFVFSDAMGVSSTIDGSAGADTFDYSAYTSAVTVNLQLQTATGTGGFAAVERFLGGTLADTLTGRNIANTWHITSANTGDINGAGVLDFSSFENLTGGSLADTFIFSNAVGASGIIAGGGDTDTFDYSLSIAGVTVNLQTGAATNVGGFASIERFIATGVTDTLTAANVANIWTINGAGAGDINGAISFTAFDNLTGGSLTDSFRFATGGSITGALNGVGLANTLDYSLRSTPVTVTLQTGVATDVPIGFINIQAFVGSTASDTLIGRNVASTWHLTANNAGDIGAPGTLDFSSFENLTGGVANDGFIFGPAVVFGGAITGGAGTDTLDYGLYTTPVTADLPGNAATGTGGALTIENLIGGSADDFLIGRDSVNNSLQGGLGNDVLVGNSGIDSLVGGNGRDILIGGIGVDNLNGGLGEDILIGGTTSWDANLANLANIMTRWLAASAYGVRITDLKTSVPQLLPATTVFNDGSADVLTGGGDLDWFLTEAVDSIIDFNNPAGETNDVF
jgi:Ca2+-binding RTX toxin-like protein